MKFVAAIFAVVVLTVLGILYAVTPAEASKPDPAKIYTVHKPISWCENLNPNEELVVERGRIVYNFLNRNRDHQEVRYIAHQFRDQEVVRTFMLICKR